MPARYASRHSYLRGVVPIHLFVSLVCESVRSIGHCNDGGGAVPERRIHWVLMRIHVLYFGILRELAGTPEKDLEVRDGAAVRDVLDLCEKEIPKLKEMLPSIACAVNQQYANPDARLSAGDEVALLPPVSGGLPGTLERRYARIVHERIEREPILSGLKRGDDGAILTFEGIVRNHTRGRKTLYLDYESYEGMALEQMESLASRAIEQFQIRDVAIVHRLGRLEIGETSVLIAVASAHRGPGFEACRWLIDTLKRKVPIWKKEYFEDGAVWADGEPFPEEIPRANS
jgi:molybdopterin converting factor subunit 1